MSRRCQDCGIGTIGHVHFIGQQLYGRCSVCRTQFRFVPGQGMFATLVRVLPRPTTPKETHHHDAQS